MRKRMVYVWEAPIRLYHWVNVFLMAILLFTGFYIYNPGLTNTGAGETGFFMARIRLWHMLAAWLFIANFLFRVYWAFAGNEFARFKPWPWQRQFFQESMDTLRYYLFLKKEHILHRGHNVIAQFAYFAVMWIGSFFIILTGLAMQGEIHPGGFQERIAGWVITLFGQSYTVRMFHHLLAALFVAFIIVHLYLVIRQELLDDDGTISSIISGYKFIPMDTEAGHEEN